MSVYRKENPEYLKKSIDSLLKQTLDPNEIVIIKDGPLTSELNHVLNNYLKDYPTLFSVYEFKENHGLAYALAYGVQHAKYEYIARMDSDDVAATDRLEKQLKAIMEDQPILILDEPMNGLDKKGVLEMRSFFESLKNEGKTIILASHNKEDIDVLCDEVYEMDMGILNRIK